MSRRQISYSEIESYLARARRERAETLAKLLCDGLAQIARALTRAARWSASGRRAAAARIVRWRRRGATARELRALDDCQLKDIGVKRSEIDHIAALVAASPTGRLDRSVPDATGSAAAVDDVAHALRPPLASIRSFSEILRDNPDLPRVTRQRFLAIVLAESERLERVIQQIFQIRPST